MLEELKFKKREKVKCRILCTIITVLAIGLSLGILKFIIEVPWLINHDDVGKMFVIFLMVIVTLAVIGIAFLWFYICATAEECKDRNVSEFQINAKVDELLKELEDKEMQVSFEVVSDDFSPQFGQTILNPDFTYYVRKKAPKELEILIYKGNEKMGAWDTNYKFLFKHFKPIYGAKKERE